MPVSDKLIRDATAHLDYMINSGKEPEGLIHVSEEDRKAFDLLRFIAVMRRQGNMSQRAIEGLKAENEDLTRTIKKYKSELDSLRRDVDQLKRR